MRYYFLLSILCSSLFAIGQEKNFIDQPYIKSGATVHRSVAPDIIVLDIHLRESDERNKKSVEELEKKLLNVLDIMEIDSNKNLKLVNAESSFKKYFLKKRNIEKSKWYQLTLSDAQTASECLYAFEQEGIANVSIHKTDYSKKEDLINELRREAIIKAKNDSRLILTSIGQDVGNAIYISNNNFPNASLQQRLQGQVPGLRIRGMDSEPSYTAPMVEFKNINYSFSLEVYFEIKP